MTLRRSGTPGAPSPSFSSSTNVLRSSDLEIRPSELGPVGRFHERACSLSMPILRTRRSGFVHAGRTTSWRCCPIWTLRLTDKPRVPRVLCTAVERGRSAEYSLRLVVPTEIPDPSGRIPKWPKGTGCKPVGVRLRRFESCSAHCRSQISEVSRQPPNVDKMVRCVHRCV